MERVTGIGGVFFKAKDALRSWYRRRPEHQGPVMRLISGLTPILMAALEKRSRGSGRERSPRTIDATLKTR